MHALQHHAGERTGGCVHPVLVFTWDPEAASLLGLLFRVFFLSMPGEVGPEPLSLSLPPVKPDMHCC